MHFCLVFCVLFSFLHIHMRFVYLLSSYTLLFILKSLSGICCVYLYLYCICALFNLLALVALNSYQTYTMISKSTVIFLFLFCCKNVLENHYLVVATFFFGTYMHLKVLCVILRSVFLLKTT